MTIELLKRYKKFLNETEYPDFKKLTEFSNHVDVEAALGLGRDVFTVLGNTYTYSTKELALGELKKVKAVLEVYDAKKAIELLDNFRIICLFISCWCPSGEAAETKESTIAYFSFLPEERFEEYYDENYDADHIYQLLRNTLKDYDTKQIFQFGEPELNN